VADSSQCLLPPCAPAREINAPTRGCQMGAGVASGSGNNDVDE
jgi:hypothetical protein